MNDLKMIINGKYVLKLYCKYVENNCHKHILVKYFLFSTFFLMIIKEVKCMLSDNEMTRFYLFDLSIFVGGIRQYIGMAMLFWSVFSATLFKILFLPNNKSNLKWTQLLLALISNSDHGDILLNKNNFAKIHKLKDISVNFAWKICYYNGLYRSHCA